MRQVLMVICAFALGKAVSAAPAARPYENPVPVEYPVHGYESPTPINYYDPSPYGSIPYSPIASPLYPTLPYYPDTLPYTTPMAYYPPGSYYGIFLTLFHADHEIPAITVQFQTRITIRTINILHLRRQISISPLQFMNVCFFIFPFF